MQPAQAALTLDDVLAFNVPEYAREMAAVNRGIDEFRDNPITVGTAVASSVSPALDDLHAWLALFKSNMRDTDNRLEGNLRLRVCFAERGMEVVLKLVRNVTETQNYIDKVIENPRASVGDKQRARELRALLRALMQSVLGCERRGMTLMRNWLATLVDIVPVELRSHASPLLPKSIADLDVACQ